MPEEGLPLNVVEQGRGGWPNEGGEEEIQAPEKDPKTLALLEAEQCGGNPYPAALVTRLAVLLQALVRSFPRSLNPNAQNRPRA